MSENVGTIYYEVDANTQPLVNSTKAVDTQLDRLQGSLDKTDSAAARTGTQMTKLAVSVQAANKGVTVAQGNLERLSQTLRGLVALESIRQLITMAEAYGEMAERIRMATSSATEYEMVQQRLLKTANETYRPLKEAQEVFILTAEALRSVGYTTAEALDITDSLSLSMVKNATSTERAANATQAFAKAVQTGRVDSDTWQTILAAIPTVVNDIAKATGKSSAEIRKLGVEGKLTAQALNEGLRQSLDENRAAAASMATTLKDAVNNINNSLSTYLGEANSASGATGVLSAALIALGNNISTVVNLLTALGAGALTKYIAGTLQAVGAHAQATIAAQAQAAAELRLAQAQVQQTAATLAQVTALRGLGATHAEVAAAETAHAAASARLATATAGVATVGRTLLGVLGGPVGIVALLATAAASVYLFRDSTEAAKPRVDSLKTSVENLSTAAERAQRRFADLSAGIDRMNRQELQIRTSEVEAALKRAQSDLKRYQRQFESGNSSISKGLVDQTKASIAELEKQLQTLGAARPGASSPETEKQLDNMRKELELAKLTGEARAKLQAIQKLGNSATPEERAEAEQLAAQIYALETARKSELSTAKKAATEKESAAKKAANEERKGIEQNIEAFQKLSAELAKVSLNSREAAMQAAELSLNEYATPAQVQAVRDMADALWRMREGQALLRQMDPLANEQNNFAEQLRNLQLLNDQKLLSDQRYLELKAQAQYAHDEQMRMLQEENFRRQSYWNDALMDGVDALGSATTSTLSGIASGTFNAAEAGRQFASVILNEAVGSVVQLGVQWVKSQLMAQAATQATAATQTAAIGTVTAAQTAATATTAATTTTAAATTGAAVTTSMAPAAAMSSIASFGGAAIIGGAALLATLALAKSSGGRQYGGPVGAGNMYRINETGAPEIFNAANGQQFMMPGTRGSVVPMEGGGGGVNMQVNITVDMGSGTSSTDSTDASTEGMAIANGLRIVVIDQLQREMGQGGMIREFVQNGGR